MNKIIIIGVIVLAALYLLSKKQKPAEQTTPSQPAGPLDIVQENVNQLQKAIEQKLPEVKGTIDPVIQKAEQIVNSFKAEMEAIEIHKQGAEDAILLDSTQVAPGEMEPKHKFVSVAPAGEPGITIISQRPRILPEGILPGTKKEKTLQKILKQSGLI